MQIDRRKFLEYLTAATVTATPVLAGSQGANDMYGLIVKTTVSLLNPGAKIMNVQWDFDHGNRFKSTPGYSFVRGRKKEPQLQAQYQFPATGKKRIACKVQDDMGGEGPWTGEIEVS